jgi:hypothetical protein
LHPLSADGGGRQDGVGARKGEIKRDRNFAREKKAIIFAVAFGKRPAKGREKRSTRC